jgi:hypothetical protein
MPEISRFYGIVIRMFAEAGAQHHRPHFHAIYQDHAAIVAIGSYSAATCQSRSDAWSTPGRNSTVPSCWKIGPSLHSGQPPVKIDPLT